MEREIAKGLLSIGAVFLRPEQPLPGRRYQKPDLLRQPVDSDRPEVRKKVEAAIAETVKGEIPRVRGADGNIDGRHRSCGHRRDDPRPADGICPQRLEGSRSGNQIEGKLEKGQKVVVIEDLISTAGSCIEVVEALRAAGAEVLGVVSIFTYGMKKGLVRLAAADVINHSLSNLDALVK